MKFAVFRGSPETHLQHVAPVGVAQISAPNLGGHVPPAEGRGRKLDAPAVEQHPGHGRQCVPAQVQVGEPLERRMAERHLHDQVGREVEVIRVVAVRGQHQRQNVPLGSFAFPAQFDAKLCVCAKINFQRSSNR